MTGDGTGTPGREWSADGVGTAAPRSCENQGFLSTDCAPADAGTKRYPENALQGLNLGF